MTYAEFMQKRGMVGNEKNEPTPEQEPNPNLAENGNGNTETKISLADLSKADLLQFAGKRKLYDESFKELGPVAIIPVILEKARAKVVEAGLKTANEAASLAEDELFALFDTIKVQ